MTLPLLNFERRKTSYFVWVNILTLHDYYEYKQLKNVFICITKLSEILISTCDNSVNAMRHYNWLDDKNKYLSAVGNWAFVTRNVEIPRSCRRCTKLLISGYIIGSPTNDNAQCFTSIPSANRSGKTPGTPEIKSHTYYSTAPILCLWGGSLKNCVKFGTA